MNKTFGRLAFACLSSSLLLSSVTDAANISVTTATTTIQQLADDTLTLSGDGSILNAIGAVWINGGTTGATVNINDTTAAKELEATIGSGRVIYVQSSVTGPYNVDINVASGAVVQGADVALLNGPATGATGTLTLTNGGTFRSTAQNATRFISGPTMPIVISNSGLIESTSNDGMQFARATAVTVPTTITNSASGSILGNMQGILFSDSTSSTGIITLNNSGLIRGNLASGLSLQLSGNLTHIFNNLAGGTITSIASHGLVLGSNNTAITSNAGTITANAANSSGINVGANSDTINNTGTIQGLGSGTSSYGIRSMQGTLNTLNNNAGGVIKSTVGTAIMREVGGTGVITTINNAGTITKGSDAAAKAIDLSQQAVSTTINNTGGVVTGDINFPASSSSAFNVSGGVINGTVNLPTGAIGTVTLSGGSIAGALIGAAGSANILNVTGNYTTAGTMSNLKTLRVQNNGTTFGVAHALTGFGTEISTAAGSRLLIKDGGSIAGSVPTTFTNSGTLAFELRQGADKTTAAATNPATLNGYINIGTKAYDATAKTVEYQRVGTDVIEVDARFYVLRGSAITNGNLAILSTTSASNSPLLRFTPKSDATGLYFEAVAVPPVVIAASSTATPAEIAVGTSPVMNAIYNATLTKSIETQPLTNIFNALAAIPTAEKLEAALIDLGPLGSESELATSSVAINNLLSGALSSRLDVLHASLIKSKTSYVAGPREESPAVWGVLVGNNYRQSSRGRNAGFNGTTAGIAFGADTSVTSDFVGGVGGFYTNSHIKTKDAISDKSHVKSLSGIAYGAYGIADNVVLDLAFNYVRHTYINRRNITLEGFRSLATGRYNGNQFGANVAGAYRLTQKIWEFTPRLGMKFSHIDLGPYMETGGVDGVNLNVARRVVLESAAFSTLHCKTNIQRKNLTWAPGFYMGIYYDFRAAVNASFAQFVIGGRPVGTAFVTQGTKEPRFSWNAGASLALMSTEHLESQLQIEYSGKPQFSVYGARLNLRYVW